MTTNNVMHMKPKYGLLILLVPLFALGIVVVFSFTRFGLGTTGDSVHYLMGAESLLAGNGFSRFSGGGELRPITMFPPFYSDVLAGIRLTGVDIVDGVRVLQALLFGANILLVGVLIYRYCRSYWASLLGGLFILTAKDLVLYHGWLLTESLFIFFLLLVIYGLVQYLDTQKVYLLIFIGILIGLATLTRYVGLSLAMAGVLSILFLSGAKWKKRFLDCAILVAVSLPPVYLWLRRNAAISGTLVNRVFSFHPVSGELFQAYRAAISFWFVPGQLDFPHSLRKALMLLLAIPGPAIFFLLELKEKFLKRGQNRHTFWTLPWVIGFFLLSYVGILFLNLTLLDAISDFNTVARYLIPVYVSAVILFVIAFHRLIHWKESWIALRAFVLAIALALIVLYAQQTFAMIQDPISSIGYTGWKYRMLETVAMLDTIDRSAPIISNDPEMLFIFADRPAYLLPIAFDYHTSTEREDFDQQLEATREKLDQGGVIVLFSPMTDSDFEVVDLLDVEMLDAFYGSSFYGHPEAIAR